MVDLSRSQREIQKAARDFAKGEFDKDQAREMDHAGIFPEKIKQKAAELGFAGIHFPEQYGGGGLGLLESVLVAETFCRQDATIGCALTLAGIGAECLLYFGAEELKRCFSDGCGRRAGRRRRSFWRSGQRYGTGRTADNGPAGRRSLADRGDQRSCAQLRASRFLHCRMSHRA